MSAQQVPIADRSAKMADPSSVVDIEAVQTNTPITKPTHSDKVGDAPPAEDSSARIVELVKGEKDGRFGFARGSRLVNDLAMMVGFMELANAGDFAANVWNDVPVPIYALVFMAIGGTVAAVLCVFAFRDSRLARKNVNFLRQQRRDAEEERTRRLGRGEPVRDIDVYLAVSLRELGSETIARWLMDLLMGGGAVLISIGTYMAIGGANRKVWLASNILSGYLGNAPIALYGLVNTCWAGFIFCKVQRHINATCRPLKGSRAATLVKRRARNVQVFCVINGTATTMGGVGSMVTATRWWGYVVLIPVIVSSIFCNIWWRRRVGYTRSRPTPTQFPALVPADLVVMLEFAARAEIAIQQSSESPVDQFVSDPDSLAEVLAFIERHDLLDEYALRVANADDTRAALGGNQSTQLSVGVDNLLSLPESLHPQMLAMAQDCLRELGPEHFRNRERYAAELLGSYYCIAGDVDFDGAANDTGDK